MVNIEAVKRILESQGKLDFKPFHFKNAKQDYWAYRTNENEFYVCDDNLIDISHSEIGIDNPWYFVLNTEKDYRLLEEGESVSVIQDINPDNLIKNVWLIKEYMEGSEIAEKDIDGYKSVTDNLIIFETETIEIKPNKLNYWIPEKQIACYNSWDFLEESDVFYCGTYNDSDLFFSKSGYHMECKHTYGRESRWHYFDKLVVWFCKDGFMLVNICPKNGSFLFELYVHAVIMEESYGWNYIGDKCIGSHIINENFNLSEFNLFANDNVFVLSNYRPWISSWITIDRFGNLGCIVTEKRGKIVDFSNDILKVDSSPCGEQGKEFEFYDYKGNCLARITNKNVNYVTVTKSFDTAIVVDESNKDSILTLKGVINTRTHSLIIPFRYKNLELFDAGDYFYAIIGEEFTDKSGAKAIQYGLLHNNVLLLPCNNVEIKSLSENLFVWKEGKKYGLICNGKKCTDCIYDNISEEKSIGRRKIRDKYLHDTYNYIKYSYAILQTDNKKGVFVPNWDILIPATYTEIKAFVEERAILADGKLFNIKERTLILDKDLSDFDYIGGLRGYHLFRRIGGDINDIDNYICFYLPDEDWMEEGVWDVEEDDEIEADREHILWSNYRPVLALGDGTVFYSVKEDRFYDDINDLASYPDYYPDDDYDYERDTYYALGGDDYDQWKENGGDLDGMMEGMGF